MMATHLGITRVGELNKGKEGRAKGLLDVDVDNLSKLKEWRE